MLRTFGLTFPDQTPVVMSDPNRADIALFIGFVARRPHTSLPASISTWLVNQGWDRIASQRPFAYRLEQLLNVPVPIDNWQVFDHLFQWDQPLHVNGASRTTTPLGVAVRSFFNQGGRKCYVVRAGEPLAAGFVPGNREAFIQRWIDFVVPGYPVGFEGAAADPSDWRGVAHLFGLPDVSLLSMPDLPYIVGAPQPEISPIFQPAEPPQVFVECSDGEEMAFPEDFRAPLAVPRCDSPGYAVWARAISITADFLRNHRREVQLIAGIPIPNLGEAADANLLEALLEKGTGPLSRSPAIFPDGIASAFVQLAYPWLRTSGSQQLPEGLENPEGVLTGLLARNALGRGAYFSAAGMNPTDVFDVYPLLSGAQMYRALPVINDDFPAQRSLIERISLFGPTPSGIRLLSDVTTSLAENYRPAAVSRLVAVIVRAARRLGEVLAFGSSGEDLWEQTRDSLDNLMQSLFEAGALQGSTPAEAFSIRCDRSTMAQKDIDTGRVIAVIQFAAAAPVERITVSLTLNEGGEVSLVSEDKELLRGKDSPREPDAVLEIVARDSLAHQNFLTRDNRFLRLALDNVPQLIVFPSGPLTPSEIVAAVNATLHWGYARLGTSVENGSANHLVIGIEYPSKRATLTVEQNAALGFPETVHITSS